MSLSWAEVLDTGDEAASASDSQSTQLIPEEYFLNRPKDLTPFSPRPKIAQKRKRTTSNPSSERDIEMEQATQQATQPLHNARRIGSNVSEADASDIICLLHPHSPAAYDAVKATMLNAPQHILPNDDLDGITEEDFDLNPELSLTNNPRVIALRMSSNVKKPTKGFLFGRNPRLVDVMLVRNEHVKLVSNIHFKIFVNTQGSLMLENLSMNGLVVDDDQLQAGNPRIPASRALQNGTIICLFGRNKIEIKLMVRTLNRGEHEAKFEARLRKYLKLRGQTAQFGSMRESTYGNHWNGGSIYNFTGLLGKGAFAMVYKVQTKVQGKVLAAKELDKRRFIKNGILDIKFDNELKIMKQLHHPNIVQYEAYHEFEQWIYIFMEYVPYGELSTELRTHGPLAESMVQTITRQILHALNYLHRRNITHRDIKPDNILISSRDPLVVKLSDFGLSKCVTNQETFLKTFCGTLLYCAPEIYPDYSNYTRGITPKRRRVGEAAPRGSPYNQSVDMWSFGAVLFHLLCDKAPIVGRADDRGAQMLNNIMTKEVNFDPLREQGVSNEAIDFVSHLLNRNPMLRPTEKQCFQHKWLANVEDVLEYDVEDEVEEIFSQSRNLGALEEVDEENYEDADAFDVMMELEDLTRKAAKAPMPEPEVEPPAKKPRRSARVAVVPPEETVMQDVVYPTLPTSMPPPKLTAPARLFGEITPSTLRSSGVLGASPTGQDIPVIRYQVEQISVNDFVTMDTDFSAQHTIESSEDPLQYPHTLGAPGANDAAPSLFGAESEIEQLNMASLEAPVSDAPTPDTTNPVTPREVDPSPSSVPTKSINEEDHSSRPPLSQPTFSRRIDLNVLDDEVAYAASLQARQAARELSRSKAATFQTQLAINQNIDQIIAARAARTHSTGSEDPNVLHNRRINFATTKLAKSSSAANSPGNFDKLERSLGSLKALPDSYADITIPLEARMTSWGRGLGCTVEYPDKKDTRIPKFALSITFWTPGMEKHIEEGKDWTMLPGIRTIVSTSTTKCIWVNDVELRAESATDDAALYGKVYTGDVITVWKGFPGDSSLKFRVEVLFGDSARERPVEEKGFQVQKEVHYHRAARESVKETLAATRTL